MKPFFIFTFLLAAFSGFAQVTVLPVEYLNKTDIRFTANKETVYISCHPDYANYALSDGKTTIFMLNTLNVQKANTKVDYPLFYLSDGPHPAELLPNAFYIGFKENGCSLLISPTYGLLNGKYIENFSILLYFQISKYLQTRSIMD